MDNEILKTYEIVGKIGQGSGGTIYKAYHKRLQKMVVLKKLINPKQSMEANRREVNILKELNNTYLPQVIDFLNTDAGVFTVMSFVPGRSFKEIMQDGDRDFSKEDLLKWALQMCNAVHNLHTLSQPIIHGDIKPSNVMLTPEGNICIIDFNISMYMEEQTVLGCTRGYTSPEQYQAVLNRKNHLPTGYVLDETTDIYSIGATLYYLATGQLREYEQEIDMDLLSERIGPAFAEVIQKSMEIDPRRRYQSAYDMYKALQAVPEKGRQHSRKNHIAGAKLAAIIIAVLLAIAAIAGGILLFKHHQSSVYAQLVEKQSNSIRDGNYDREVDYYTQAVEKKPHEPAAYYWHAYADYSCGDYLQCIAKVEDSFQFIKESSSSDSRKGIADLYVLKGSALLAIGESKFNQEAVKAFDEAISHYPEMDSNEYRQYAVALARTGRNEEAWDVLNKADQKDGGEGSPQSDNTRGEICKAEGNVSDAAKYFDRCIHALKQNKSRTSPEESLLRNTYMSEAYMFAEHGNTGQAKKLMQDAVENLQLGGQITANRNLGIWDYGSKEYNEAIRCFEQIIGTGQANADDYEYLGECYVAKNQASQVREIAERRKNEVLQGKEDFYYFRLLALAEAIDIGQNRTNNGSLFYQYYSEAQRRSDSETAEAMADLSGVYERISNNNY